MANITIPGMFLTGNHAGRPSSDVGTGTLYACSTHGLIYQTTDDGTTWGTWATLGTTGSVATDAIWNAAGDLAVGTGSDTAARLAIGANGTVLTSNGTTAGWASPPGGGGGGPVAAEFFKSYAKDAQNTASWSKSITAVPTDRRLIVAIASYARDVNTPTCTNVTFTEILAVTFGGAFLSIYLGVPSSTSGTTLAITATGANWIIGDVYEVYDSLTGSVVDDATASGTSASAGADTHIGPLTGVDVGTFYVAAVAQDDGTTGFTGMFVNAADSLANKITAGSNAGLVSSIGRTCAENLRTYYTGGTSGGDYAAGIVAIT